MPAARQTETDPALEQYRGGVLVTVGHFKPERPVPEWRDLVIIDAPHMRELDRKSFQRGIAYKLIDWWTETGADQSRLKDFVQGYRSMLPPPSQAAVIEPAAPIQEAPALRLVQDKPAPKKSAAKRGRTVEISRDESGKLIF